jgi:Asp-tRNA(Asn)/Glu-tRNA(Gln) amidotransferase A subunit family amidase
MQQTTHRTAARVARLSAFSAALVGIGFLLGSVAQEQQQRLTRSIIAQAERVIGLQFSEQQRDSLLDEVNANLEQYDQVRRVTLPNSVPPAVVFDPIPQGFTPPTATSFQTSRVTPLLPNNREDLAWYSIGELAALIKARKITSVELTTLYLNRLKKYGNELLCTVTLTEERALQEARKADAEIAQGKYRGLLHGIPYGLKDLFATTTYKTTWGSALYKDQVIDADATVVKKLSEAGAVLVAKLSLGEFAMGDVWYAGMTRSPWNLKDGSSGSSAGSASATAAGLVAFAIGTETYGSIVSPSTRCGVTGLRPTFGRVSRTGAMALAWTFDKVGPICRTVEDCAIVFHAIYGGDGVDASVINAGFRYSPHIDIKKLRIGYVKSVFENDKGYTTSDSAALATLRSLGVELLPIELPNHLPFQTLDYLIGAEAAAAFDELTRSGKDSALVQQHKFAWGNQFRAARFIPAVEYIQAQRVRHLLIQEMAKIMHNVDVYVCPTTEGNNTLLTNLTGHPCVVVPNGFRTDGRPMSLTFCGRLFDEGTLLAVAKKFQDATQFHKQRSPLAR